MTNRPIILASNSPRRRQLLALAGLEFSVIVAGVDESLQANESPASYVLRLAETKARTVAAVPDQIVLAADTTVVDGNHILGKPHDAAEARIMLTQLRGRTHQVYTGIALLRKSDDTLLTALSVTDVPMRNYSDEELNTYIATGDPLDKAGAYAIQHPEFKPVAHMDGCFAGVMGLPLCHVLRLLRQLGTNPQADLPAQCQALLEYSCPVSDQVLSGAL